MIKIMKNKKEYNAPEIKIIKVKHQTPLLDCSQTDGCTDDFGLAPHEQDPIA
jgi:hypothetical protein